MFNILSLILSFLIFIGCNGGGESSSNNINASDNKTKNISADIPLNLNKGVFLDSAVYGVSYKTDTQYGITNETGEFNFKSGETIEFYIGNTILGKTIAKDVITPVDLVQGATDELNPAVTNICRFLISLDKDGDPENGIYISDEIRRELEGKAINFFLTIDEFEKNYDVQSALDLINSLGLFLDGSNRKLCSPRLAQSHIRETLNGLGQWKQPAASILSNIGSEGGTLEINTSGNPIKGTKIIIPADSLSEKKAITISYTANPKQLPLDSKAIGEYIDFGSHGINFKSPVSVYIPYYDEDKDGIIDGTNISESKAGVLYFNTNTLKWESINITAIDTVKKLLIFKTDHFSTYVASLVNVINTNKSDITKFKKGDYFINVFCCSPYYITMLLKNSRYLTFIDSGIVSETGYSGVISADGKSVTFDASSIFPKIKASGDAQLWKWSSHFDAHTFLKNYHAFEDTIINTTTKEVLYSKIESIDLNTIKISWDFNIFEEIYYFSTNQTAGHILAIAFEAVYK